MDADGFLLPPDDDSGGPVRPGIHWLLPYEVADSSGMRSVAPLRWYRYAVGEAIQGRPTGVDWLRHMDDRQCGFWVLGSREELDGAAPVGLALSRPALRSLREDDIPGLDVMLTAAGFPHQPSDADGGYDYAGDYRNPAGRYPRRTVAGLARIREDLDIAIVRYEEAGPQFEGHVTTWTLVEFLEGHARAVSTFSGDRSLCTRRPAENHTEAVWVALTSANGSRLDPVGRRHPDGSWDLPWPDWLEGFAVDSSGFLQPPPRRSEETPRPADGWPLPFRVVEGDRVRVDVPLQWYRYPRWNDEPGTVTHVMLATRHCLSGWSLHMDPGWNMADGQGRGVGVALSRPPAARLVEEDVPGLDAIRAKIGLLDQPSRDRGGYQKGGSWYPKREVLGLFRLDDDIIIGVVGEYGYEGENTVVFEIGGDSARIVSTASMGGC